MINFMIDNYTKYLLIIIFIVLAVIGYTVENIRMQNLKREYEDKYNNDKTIAETITDKVIATDNKNNWL